MNCNTTHYRANSSSVPGDPTLLGREAVQKKWGVPPEKIGDVLALIGDSVDNIPGVAGLGPKTAVALIEQFGSIKALMENLSAVKSEKVRLKLEAAEAQIHANCEMVRLDLDLPLPVPLSELSIRPRYPEYIEALRTCEFKGLLAEVEAEASSHLPLVQSELF